LAFNNQGQFLNNLTTSLFQRFLKQLFYKLYTELSTGFGDIRGTLKINVPRDQTFEAITFLRHLRNVD